MTLTEVETLMNWVDSNSIAEYVKIDALRDAILDLLEQTHIEDVIAPIMIGEV